MSHFTYLTLLLCSISYPLYKSFESKLQFWKKWKYLFPSIFITATLFIAWDVYFAKYGVWSFNNRYILGLTILHLPIEEWLFFMVIPYSCFFIYESLCYFLSNIQFKKESLFLFILIGIIFLIILINNYQQMYTLVATGIAIVSLLFIGFNSYIRKFLPFFLITYFISLIPFLIINGVLTSLPVVIYNDSENMAFRIFSIPFEDFIYLLALLFINFALYEIFNKNARKQIKS